MPRLTDTQLVLLNAAANRDDGCLLPVPDSIKAKGAALERSLNALLKADLVSEAPANKDQAAWKTADDLRPITLVLTDAGRAALETGTSEAPQAKPSRRPTHPRSKPSPHGSSTRSATILSLLSGKAGASLEELQAATGWQAHSVRGFLSGTVRRKMGLELISEPDRSGTRRYRLASPLKKGRH